MKYDIITELENNIFIKNNSIIKALSNDQVKDLRYILSKFNFKPGCVCVGKKDKNNIIGTITMPNDEIDYEASNNSARELHFKISYEVEDDMITSFKFLKNNEEFKIIKKINNGLIVVDSFKTLFKTGFYLQNDILMHIKYYDQDALSLLKNNCISDSMENELKKKGIIPDQEAKFNVPHDSLIEYVQMIFTSPLDAYNQLAEYVKSNGIFDINIINKSKIK